MKNRFAVRAVFAVAAIILPLTACAESPNEGAMVELSGYTKKLADMVQSAVKYRDAPDDLSEEELYTFATSGNLWIREQFEGYSVRPYRAGSNGAVLICDAEGATALLEDANCSPAFDKHHWRHAPDTPCAPTLDLSALCEN